MATEPIEVEYRVPKNADIGYVQIFASPWNPEFTVLAVLGNTDVGLEQARNALAAPELRKQMIGNLAMLNNGRVYAEEVRTLSRKPTIATIVPVTGKPADTKTTTPTWLLPAIAISIGSVFILLSLLGFLWARRRRKQQYQANLTKNQPRPRFAIAPPAQLTPHAGIRDADQWEDYDDDDLDDDDEAGVGNSGTSAAPQGHGPKPSAFPAQPNRSSRIARQTQRPAQWRKD